MRDAIYNRDALDKNASGCCGNASPLKLREHGAALPQETVRHLAIFS
jgi:hypothetical protein